MAKEQLKFWSLVELFEFLPRDEALLTDVLRELTIETLNGYGKEKLSYNVPFFYGNKSICLIFPASVPRSGVKSGVLFGFWYGNRLKDENNYLTHGRNKQVYYKIYQSVDEIDTPVLTNVIKEAVDLDKSFRIAGLVATDA
ncbi:hypothetical protein GCM10007415_00270 [Parapedobacter pyrenivorans]|uniref:YdhG-like domain-containing protein n=1 Tax=Parapedobacter pyrenivorans TaxID=1305674 RepID=A0A917HB03_9SPHI|nr:DUF1801 domain-containing protein [Parapedobacter pyrenivorans]GGG72907.1 hypothetical protein GCM10007415_00270 [Parapedobacter pyrenivorans]